jgi:hypothetical protein
MKQAGTALVVATVAVIAAAALLDALRPDARNPSAAGQTEPSSTGDEPGPLARAGVPGELLFTTRTGGTCALGGIRLSTLARTDYLAGVPCRFAAAPDGRTVALDGGCGPRRSIILQSLVTDVATGPIRGCLPAWRPSGMLTFVRDREVVGIRSRSCDPMRADCFQVLLPKRALAARANRLQRTRTARPAVVGLGWLTERRAVVVALDSAYLVFAFEHGRPLRFRDPGGRFSGDVVDIALDENGGWLLARFDDDSRTAFTVDGRGEIVNNIGPPDLRALALSRDGRWVALARPGSVCIFRRGDLGRSVGCLDVDAVDLAWR